jgi:hypothetical protein
LSNDLIRAVLEHLITRNKNTYAYVRHNNPASIKVLKNSFVKVCNAMTIGMLHKVNEDPNGRLGIYK